MLIVIGLWGYIARAQSQFELLRQIYVAHNLFEADSLGNVYTSQHNVLVYFAPNGTKIEKKLPLWGEITGISRSKNGQLIVFSSPDNKVLVLDSALELVVPPIDLALYGLERCKAATAASDGLIWLFDNYLSYAFSVDSTENILVETGTVSRFANEPIDVRAMVEAEGYLFVNECNSGIHIFTLSGKSFGKLPYTEVNDFQVSGRKFMFVRNKVGIFRDLDTEREGHFELPENTIKVRVFGDIFYCSDNKTISIFRKIK